MPTEIIVLQWQLYILKRCLTRVDNSIIECFAYHSKLQHYLDKFLCSTENDPDYEQQLFAHNPPEWLLRDNAEDDPGNRNSQYNNDIN